MSLLFWSDTHFNHEGIIRYCARPFSSVEEMNESMIARWNAAVSPRDTIYLLGDFGFKGSQTLEGIFRRLNGHKHLVIGNHDERNPEVGRLPWETQGSLRTIKWGGRRAEACHYALETWKGAHRGALMLHGHSHGSLKRAIPHRFDVGVDVRASGPVSWDQLHSDAALQVFEPADHHGDL